MKEELLAPYVPEPAAAGRRSARRRWPALVAASLVVALAGGGAFVAAVQAGDDRPRGPESAVERLIDAAVVSDVAGVLEAVTPTERRALTAPRLDTRAELTRLGLFGAGLDPSAVAGASVELAPGVVAVQVVQGDVSVTFDHRLFPLGGDEAAAAADGDLPRATEGELVIVAVEERGAWHVSLWHSVAEAARRAAGKAMPTPDEAAPAVGAPTPEAAVEAFLTASVSADQRRMLELVAPIEGRVLHTYGALLIEAAEPFEPFPMPEVDVSDVRLSTSGAGDRRRVVVDHAAFSVAADDGFPASTMELDGPCWRFDGFDTCEPSVLGVPVPVVATGFEVVLEEGAWFVDPVATQRSAVVDGTQAEGAEDAPTLQPFGLMVFGIATPLFPFADGFGLGLDEGFDEGFDDDVVEIGPACDEELDDAAIEACLRAAVESGELPQVALDLFEEEQIALACYEPVSQALAAGDEAQLADAFLAGVACMAAAIAESGVAEIEPGFHASAACYTGAPLSGSNEDAREAAVRRCLEVGVATGSIDEAELELF